MSPDVETRFSYLVIGIALVIVVASSAILGGVSSSGEEGGQVTQNVSGFQPVTMSDVPQKYRDVVVSKDTQRSTSKYYQNVEDESLLDRNWSAVNASYSNKSYHSHSSRMVEFTQYPKSNVTIEQLNESWELYYDTYKAADENNWFNISTARDDNYYEFDKLHYINLNELYNDEELNPNQPESLMYRTQDVVTESGHQKSVTRLVGVMYLQNSFDHGEQIGGPLTVWHHHRKTGPTCLGETETQYILGNQSIPRSRFNATPNELLPNGEQLLQESKNCTQEKSYSMEMMHVWLEKRPGGPFASPMVSKSRPPEQYPMMNKTEFVSYTLDRYQTIRNNASMK